MTGVDYLIEIGIADGGRMAKMGWSGGGHMTNKIITHTGRFKAARVFISRRVNLMDGGLPFRIVICI